MSWPTRRQFLQVSGAAAMVGVTRSASAAPSSSGRASGPETDGSLEVNFWGDGIMPTPAEHAAALSRHGLIRLYVNET